MKNLLEKLAVYYLRKSKVGVMIGFDIKDGIIKEKERKNYFYDNNFNECKNYDKDGFEWIMPDGKFALYIERKEQINEHTKNA